MEDCIFCKIINKEIPAEIIYENEFAVVFKDIHPQASVHVVVVPKKHIKSLNYIDETFSADLLGIHLAVKEVAKMLGVSESGYRLISNCGKNAGQSVFHLHYHLIAGSKLGQKLL
ncbi:MAG TPA: histidine triad nucleotide-binding protein [Clostridia bacterium]|jgi:histidine triad (HIT) family protein|nr:histidine triad nucleotide-binding protein [Clostridia bacterium]